MIFSQSITFVRGKQRSLHSQLARGSGATQRWLLHHLVMMQIGVCLISLVEIYRLFPSFILPLIYVRRLDRHAVGYNALGLIHTSGTFHYSGAIGSI
jgi:hypothetical protein